MPLGDACLMADRSPCETYGLPLRIHHIVNQQTLRKHGHGDKLGDRRNMVEICEYHHRRHHNYRERIPRRLLPPDAITFADEVGLNWWLDRFYPKEDE